MMNATRPRAGLAAVALCALLPALCSAQKLPSDVEWTQVSGTKTAFATWQEGSQAWAAISNDNGNTLQQISAVDPRIMLRYARFDPLMGAPRVPAILRAPRETKLAIVQFRTRVLESYQEALRGLGVEILHFVPWNAVLVRMDAVQRTKLSALPWVRWTGAWEMAYRMDELMQRELLSGAMPTRRYNIHTTRKGLIEKEPIAAFIESIGGLVSASLSPHGYLMSAELSAPQLLAVAARDDILFIDRWSAPEEDMDIGRELHGANHIAAMEGLEGQGVRAEVMDGGFRQTHQEFQNPPTIIQSNSGSTGHGTSTYGQVFATGVNPQATGGAPKAQGIFSTYTSLGDRYAHTANLVNNLNAVLQSNSWGDARTFFYTTVSADMDNILFDNDIVITQSQSNAGDQDSRPQAWAKNIVSVGGIRHQNTLTTLDDSWTNGASIGPASDGRIKPDLSSFYDNIFTTSSGSDSSYTSTFGGTSGATPLTAGHILIFFQMWSRALFNNAVSGVSVFNDRPHMTTAKAMMINSASQYPFSGAGADLTRVHQGWGRPDLKKMYERRQRVLVIDESDLIAPLATNSYSVTVPAGETEFHATLIFADPPGNPAAAVHRINDLSLRVTDPQGTVYFGNNGLLTGTTSTAGGSANTVDTVENVIVANPMSGSWSVEVIASDIVQDGHVETPALDADYALVVSGIDQPTPSGDSGQPNSAAASLRFMGALNGFGLTHNPGINGPFFTTMNSGDSLSFNFAGPANNAFILLGGPLNKNNLVVSGIGSLDLGLNGGSGSISDVSFLMNGVSGNSFFDVLAFLGPDGLQNLSFSTNGVPAGVFGAFQAVMFDPSSSSFTLSAATEVAFQ